LQQAANSSSLVVFSSVITFSSVIPVPIFIGINSSRNPGGKREAVNKQPAVYILASRRNGTLYTGVTSDLVKRIWEHRSDLVEGFTRRYGVHHLVWYELHQSMESAIQREKRLKGWKRGWKVAPLAWMGRPLRGFR
jgi:putative endonuclease